MTVSSMQGDKVICQWFDKSEKLQSNEFLISQLDYEPKKLPDSKIVVRFVEPKKPDDNN